MQLIKLIIAQERLCKFTINVMFLITTYIMTAFSAFTIVNRSSTSIRFAMYIRAMLVTTFTMLSMKIGLREH